MAGYKTLSPIRHPHIPKSPTVQGVTLKKSQTSILKKIADILFIQVSSIVKH